MTSGVQLGYTTPSGHNLYFDDSGNLVIDGNVVIGPNGATVQGTDTAQSFTVTGMPGATTQFRIVGGTTAGAPVSGTFAKGDVVVDQTGTVWVCTAAGTPGTWTPSESETVVRRSATATAALGEVTVFNGSTPAQTITLPASPVEGSYFAIINNASVSVSILGGTNSVIIGATTYGAASPFTVVANGIYEFVFDATGIWYCRNNNDLTQSIGTLAITSGGTGATSAGAALTALGAAPLASPTFTGTITAPVMIESVSSITAVANAATVPITTSNAKVTNNSAATITITMATASATDGAVTSVRVYDFSAAAQTITWVNTENSAVTPAATSNGSTTLPKTLQFQFNGATSKWRCILSV